MSPRPPENDRSKLRSVCAHRRHMNTGSRILRFLGGRCRGRSVVFAVLSVQPLAWLCLAGSAAASVDESVFHTEPHIGWEWGDHHLDFGVDFRYRYENWRAFAADNSSFNAIRTRFDLAYRYRETFRFLIEGQQASLFSLDDLPRASGEARLYRAAAEESDPNSINLSRLVAEVRGSSESWLRLGRDFVNEKTLFRSEESPNEESSWSLLKRERLSERLLGSIDWSHGARAFDGASGGAKIGEHNVLRAFVFQPTTGVYELKGGYDFQKGVIVGGFDWTVLRGKWFENTEIGAFFIAYSDDRDAGDVAGLEGDIEVYTFGASWLGVYSIGPGRLDALAWGAFQFGKYVDRGPSSGTKTRDQLAGAFVAEVGYQLPALWSAPWLRLGFNYGSGDGDLDDGDRTTFFNIIPSNHGYYGYADQLALQNLLDLLVQLKFVPAERIRVELTYHRFWLDESADFRWSGTGAFNRTTLGFVRNPSNGSEDVGHEVDLVVRAPLDAGVTLSAGYSAMLGGEVFALSSNSNLDFAFVQMAFEY